MRKASIPQPKYSIGETLIFFEPSEGNDAQKKKLGIVQSIKIFMNANVNSVTYQFEGTDDNYDESHIIRRIKL